MLLEVGLLLGFGSSDGGNNVLAKINPPAKQLKKPKQSSKNKPIFDFAETEAAFFISSIVSVYTHENSRQSVAFSQKMRKSSFRLIDVLYYWGRDRIVFSDQFTRCSLRVVLC